VTNLVAIPLPPIAISGESRILFGRCRAGTIASGSTLDYWQQTFKAGQETIIFRHSRREEGNARHAFRARKRSARDDTFDADEFA
jgi:hypothetical protein